MSASPKPTTGMRVIPFLYPWMLCHELHDPEELWTIVEHLWVDSVARPRAVEDRRREHVEGDVGDRELVAAEVARALPVRPGAIDDQALELLQTLRSEHNVAVPPRSLAAQSLMQGAARRREETLYPLCLLQELSRCE